MSEKNRELCARYPFLLPRNGFTDEIIKDYDYSYTILDDLPTGWRESFGEEMCEELKGVLGDEINGWRIIQLKEKFGAMRLYPNWTPPEVAQVIHKYSELSEHICVRCGARATHLSRGWILPYCEDCARRTFKNFERQCQPLPFNKEKET